jgi:hypothetical protein
MAADPLIPASIGPVVFGTLGVGWVMVRCPRQYDELMRQAGGVWEPGARQWLIQRRRIGPVNSANWSARSIRCFGTLASGCTIGDVRLAHLVRRMFQAIAARIGKCRLARRDSDF